MIISTILNYHIYALAAGFVLDLILGDPECFPHSIRLIGNLISSLENKLNKGTGSTRLKNGGILVISVIFVVTALTALMLVGVYLLSPYLGLLVHSLMVWQVLAIKSLKVAAFKILGELEKDDISGARRELSMIVGRETKELTKEQIITACVESVSENTSDGIIAPLLYTGLGGPVLGFVYKAINTMDSMVGYKNERYNYFGRVAAKVDDIANFLPARLSAGLIITCAFIMKSYSGKNALRIFLRDRFNHESPNSAQSMSACGGALGIRLGGPASYFGKLKEKPFMGDALKPPEPDDIRRACGLMLGATFILFGMIMIVLVMIRH